MTRNPINKVYRILASCWLVAAAYAHAGTIVLTNGDRISGDLMEIVDGQVRWHSPLLGEISVPQVNISAIETRKPFHVQLGSEQRLSECVLQWQGETRQQVINCQEGLVEVGDWKLVARVSSLPLLERDRWRSTGFITAAAKKASGNFEQEAYALDLRAEVRRGDHRNTLTAEYDVERHYGTKIIDQYRIRYQYDRFVSKQVYLNGNLATEKNEFHDWASRNSVGVGVGYQFFDTGLAALSVESGFSWLAEDLRYRDDHETLAFRFSTDFRWLLSRVGLEFFHRNAYMQTVNDSEDWDFRSDTGFKLPLIGRLSSEIKLRYDYDNTPAWSHLDELQRVWSAGVRYDW